MAYTQTMSPQAIHQHYRDVQAPSTPPMQRRHASKMRFVADLSQCLFDFVIQLLPTAEEMAVKEDVRKLLERLIRTIEPDSRLLSFGSTANGFSLRNSGQQLVYGLASILITKPYRYGPLLLDRLQGTASRDRSRNHVG
jgi:terminal uridylyltransferase